MKKVLSLLLATLLFSFTFVPCFALEKEKGYDTLSKTHAEYMSSLNVSTFSLTNSNDEKAIEETCKVFLSICRASVRSNDYQPSSLIDSQSLDSDKNQYRLSEYKYLSDLLISTKCEILYDTISFNGFRCKIDGNNANASIVENYSYFVNDDFNELSHQTREYYFKLEKTNNTWLIYEVTTNDPGEDENFDYTTKFSVSDVLAEPTGIITTDPDEKSNDIIPFATRYRWEYHTDVAVEYAELYYDATSSSNCNPLFGFSTSNCQNFASQCVWAGLIGDLDSALSRTSYRGIPAVYSSSSNPSITNLWCRYQRSSAHMHGTEKKSSWDQCTGFKLMLSQSTSTKDGPLGTMVYGSFRTAEVGDIIYWNKNGPASSSNPLSHAMVVTKVTGTYGSRTKNDIFIAANTSPTSTAFMKLSSYDTKYSESNYALAKISCGYYARPQNSSDIPEV